MILCRYKRTRFRHCFEKQAKYAKVSLKLYLGYWDLGIEIVCLSLM